jgi:hypothetical protein
MGKILMTTAAMMFRAAPVVAQMGAGQDDHMTGTGRGWGMGYGWGWGLILLVILVLGAAYLLKKK